MSLGIPVVASDIPELTCFLRKNVDACLVPPDDPELLALALIQLQQSDDELDKYQKAGYLVSSKFTLERMVDSYQDIYRYYGAISK
jgi:glycosyltransferase involved in cell wall biosynthesis